MHRSDILILYDARIFSFFSFRKDEDIDLLILSFCIYPITYTTLVYHSSQGNVSKREILSRQNFAVGTS